MTEQQHDHVCKDQDNWPHQEGFGCSCECGAVVHILGWQGINVLNQPEIPAKPEFDIEEYRADLTRRRDDLLDSWRLLLEAYRLDGAAHSAQAARRFRHKADGIEIALSLLPRATGN